ncbi:PP0621 family protein [Thiolapillus sp.]
MKLISLIVAVLLIWWIIRTLNRSRAMDHRQPRIRNMLPCTHCGLHVPEDEAIMRQGKAYCCREHADKDNH